MLHASPVFFHYLIEKAGSKQNHYHGIDISVVIFATLTVWY